MVRSLTVDPGEALWTGAVVFVGSCVAAGSPVQTWLPCPARVQVFVTQLSSIVGITETLPGFHTAAMNTAWMRNTLITELTLPPIQTLALSRKFTGPMFCTATLSADSSAALWTRPALQARLVSIVITLIVAKEVVPWSAELVAAKAIVVLVTAEADLELELSHRAVVIQSLPLPAGVDHPRVDGFLDHAANAAGR